MNLISFLGKRFKRFFSSGQKIPTSMFRLLTLLCLLCLMPWQGAKAISGCHWSDYQLDWAGADPESGYIHYKVRVWTSWGGEGNARCCWGVDGAPLIITQHSNPVRKIQIRMDENGGNAGCYMFQPNNVDTYGGLAYDWYDVDAPSGQGGSSERTRFYDFWVPISQDDYGQTISIDFNGHWWKKGGTGMGVDEDVYRPNHLNVYVGYPANPGLKINSYYYDCSKDANGDPLDPMISFNWGRNDASGVRGLGTVYLCEGNSKKQTSIDGFTERPASATEYFTINVDGGKINHDLNKSGSYQLMQIAERNVSWNYYSMNHSFTFNSEAFEVPAYPQIPQDGLSCNPDPSNQKITWKWKVPSASATNVDTSGFLISIEKTLLDGTDTLMTARVKYSKDVTNYSYELPLPVGEEATYRFHIERAATKNLSCWGKVYGRDIETYISTSHCYPKDSASAVLRNNSEVVINWGMTGSLWSDNTKFIIRKTNLTTTASSDIQLTKEDYQKGSYVDNLIQICNNYAYELIMKPGGTYAEKNVKVLGSFMPIETGTVKDLEVSKGYYSEKVELSWKATSAFQNIYVQRRECNSANSAFKTIYTTSANVKSEYTIADESCLPGIMYEYRVYGLSKCDNMEISSLDTLYGFGFRTPTGNFYGRVTYENGQSVDSVQVRLEADGDQTTYALGFDGTGRAEIPGEKILRDTFSATLQAWVYPQSSSTDSMVIIRKEGLCELGVAGGRVYVIAGGRSLNAGKDLPNFAYTHVTAVYNSKNIQIYLNGKLSASDSIPYLGVTGNDGNVILGERFVGQLDEVRIWNRVLSPAEIANDYTRYLVGNERNLDAYYTFDFMMADQFYDRSYVGTVFNGNTGTLSNASKVASYLNTSNLSYCGVTDESGAYSILAVPYYGNGTAYTLIPLKGTHQFTPKQEIRFIGADAQNHTVNFTDKSSFPISGFVVYKGGTYPVEGVHFTIDGVNALDSKGQYVMTGADGSFSINVPVGIHEVKAVKDGHTFELDGRICNSDGSDRNYQDMLSNILLYDNTKVKYIGRVCGGEIQEAYPVGFSLSKNNLANDMKVILKSTRSDSYDLQNNAYTEKVQHPILNGVLNRNPKAQALETIVDYNADDVTIHVNNETGEFVAWVYPIEYTVSLSVYGHEEISGDNSSLDLSSYKVEQFEKYEYIDSVYTNGVNDKDGFDKRSYTDSIGYTQKQVFTKRYTARMEVVQLDNSGREMSYFGDDSAESSSVLGEKENVQLWKDSVGYVLGYPVFSTGTNYTFKYAIFEEYPYYINSKNEVDESKTDRVAVEPTEVMFNNKMAISDSVDVDNYIYTFKVGEPSISSATGTIAAKFTYGSSDNPTSVSWINPLGNNSGMAYVLGIHQTGTNFVTAGPDKFLCVLRDPPGSNSYSYLEKGVTFSEQSTYTGSISQEGSEDFTSGVQVRAQQITLVGGVGTATTMTEVESGATVGITHSEEYTGNNSNKTTVTTTTRFQTSEDPSYVGADADLYIGYSVNVTFGNSQNVSVVSRSTYDSLGAAAYEKTYLLTDSVAVVQKNGIAIGQMFGTLFAYPQSHIEQVLIPNLKELRNSLLLLPSQADSSKLQERADKDTVNYFYSLVEAGDENFGKPNYYKAYLSKSLFFARDTIEALNAFIDGWVKALSDNDSIKATTIKNGKLKMQNYSFQGGANVEYSEAYSTAISSNHSFSITIGGKVSNDMYLGTAATKTKFEFEESVSTTQGGEFENELEASHAKGFVLAEDGSDYLSVDVFRDKEDVSESYEMEGVNSGSVDSGSLKNKASYSTFVFSTKGGATSCPYEGEYKASHWKNGEQEIINAATMKMEDPKIDMPTKFIGNVPSGEAAFLTVRMMNDSETGDDQRFDLSLLDSSNPNGAVLTIDGNPMSGTPLSYLVPAGEVLEKTLAVYKGSVLNYDDLTLVLSSQCQEDIASDVKFSVHFIPSCSNVAIEKPTNNWTYNTNCDTVTVNGVIEHYMPVVISGFDVNYTDFEHIELQYKASSDSDNDWKTLSYYYKDSTLAQKAVANGFKAFTISSNDAGKIYYDFYMDNLPDQRYDIRAVSFCNINNQLCENPSEIVSGVKDMYNPRLFGTPKPADGVLSIEDDVRINFNETIAEGKLTVNNFEVTGVRNGAVTDHSVAIALDGENDYLTTEATRNFANKDLTFECWVNYDSLQNATFFSQGDANEAISMGMNDSGKVVVKVADKVVISENAPAWEKSSWNHVALVYDNTDTTVTAYVNYTAVVNATKVNAYKGNGVVEVGRNVASQSGNFNGKVDQFRIWNAVRSLADIQGNSTAQLSGNDLNLIAYYEMDEAKGSATEDKARGANLVMKGGSWALPEGRSAEFDGASYVAMNSGAAVITSDMDFTMEFWFNAVAGAKNQTILSNGNGIKRDGEDPSKVFSIGFNEEGTLTFRHNGYTVPVNGKYADNDWHNFTLAVNRSSGNARIYMDGELNTYFPAERVKSLASDRLFAGARVCKTDTTVGRTVDQYFTGKVDEVRLWNLYRQQSQIEKFYNQKSNGDEMGLLLYYPFEHYIDWQGTAEMQFTLDDKGNDALDGSGNKLAFATKVGNVVESKNIPPVKTKGATASLLYDWVVNNDALIITLKEQDYRIEKTIVNFTVNKVQDVNGNYILSPITWSAYIDRNQLKWLDDAVTVNKKQNEAYEFEMPIVNKGGSIINYSLDNMPSWLSSSSESGVINPLEKQTIKFEIDPSLAVGTYDEVVYLTNSNNVTEPLALNVTVEGNTPDWKVDPSKYEFSMAVFAQIKVDNQFSNDEKDMLAAFYEDECVGVAHMSYDKTLDMWYALLTVYSEKSSTHELTYRIWDASTGRMYKAVSSPTVKFVNNKVSGKPTEPIVFSNSERVKYQNILLNKGWNWVSFNLKSGNISNMDTYLKGGNWTANSFVKSINKSANYSPENAKWTNSGVRLNNVNMFKIYSDVEQTLAVSGSDLDLSSTEISLKKKGWTYIAYLPTYSMTLKAALADYEATEGDVIKSKEGFAMYYGNEWIGSLKSLQPNSGYMMKNMGGEVKKFKYPTASTALRSAAVVAEKASAYESNMSVIAYAPEKKEGDLLRVLVGNEENEVVEVALTDDYALQFINVSANAGDKVRFTMERDGVTYVANNSMSFAGDAVYGTPSEPYILNFNIDAAESLSVYPNPVVDLLNVSGALNGESEVTLELFDLAGALVYTKQVSVSDNALDASISMNGFAAGSYLLKVSQNGDSKMFKIVKK